MRFAQPILGMAALLPSTSLTAWANDPGGGTSNLRIPDIRTTILANCSAFAGIINALAGGGGGKGVRMGPDYS
jgi:hypothetical protein